MVVVISIRRTRKLSNTQVHFSLDHKEVKYNFIIRNDWDAENMIQLNVLTWIFFKTMQCSDLLYMSKWTMSKFGIIIGHEALQKISLKQTTQITFDHNYLNALNIRYTNNIDYIRSSWFKCVKHPIHDTCFVLLTTEKKIHCVLPTNRSHINDFIYQWVL